MRLPDVSYARSGDVAVAYQVIGDGSPDIVFVRGIAGDLLSTWEQPLLVRHVDGLATHGRVLMLDKRGTGLSGPILNTGVPTLEQRMDDINAVMDALHWDNASLFGYAEGGSLCTLYAASFPERVRSLILCNAAARLMRADDYPWGWIPEASPMHDAAPG